MTVNLLAANIKVISWVSGPKPNNNPSSFARASQLSYDSICNLERNSDNLTQCHAQYGPRHYFKRTKLVCILPKIIPCYIINNLLRPIYMIRFVAYDSYCGICDRVNTRKIKSVRFQISPSANE